MQYDAILERPAFACRPQPNATLHAHKSHLPVECDGMSLCVLQVLRVLSGIPEVGAHAEQFLTGFALRSDAMQTCLSSICIKGSVITKIGMPSASQITRLCSKLKNLPWHWNTTSGDESERTSTGIDEPEHPDAYWCILMHTDASCYLPTALCDCLLL